jgi:hypothetical protein
LPLKTRKSHFFPFYECDKSFDLNVEAKSCKALGAIAEKYFYIILGGSDGRRTG